ncbi:uncharacterized protein LOC126265284 [Aethina tumida]|uniref:uncharacterized protein LOC126265284 n=1 Tax=Aethina tumida TaxID=116153 RepID=UPI00214832A2|nr:uncharacterized protein LOC126265284 [Aethina tumida]
MMAGADPQSFSFETRDIGTNTMVTMNGNILKSKGRCHTMHEVAYKWKKDCRIWLWKNDYQFKTKRSIAERIAEGMIYEAEQFD